MSLNISPLRPNMVFTDTNGSLTKDAYDFLFGIFHRLGGSLSNLDAASLLGASWSAPNVIGDTTPNVGTFTSLKASKALTVDGGVNANGSGLKHKRVTTTVPANSSGLVMVSWPTPFANFDYTVTCSVQDATADIASAVITHIESVDSGTVIIRINNTAATAFNGTLHVIAIHD